MEDAKELGAEYTTQILRDADTSKDTLYKFSYGVNEIYLYKLEAKDGYYWE
jgi:hypothetical protein